MASKLEFLKAQRDNVVFEINCLSDLAKESFEESLSELKLLFPELKGYYDEFRNLQAQITAQLRSKKQSPANDAEVLNQEILSQKVRDTVVKLRLHYNRLFPGEVTQNNNFGSSRQLSPASSVSSICNVRKPLLPKLNLPIFDGDKSSFMTFFELFNELVVKRDDISDIERFQYLKTSLKGEAFELVKHIPVTSNNFEVALSTLQKEYYKPRILRSVHIQNLLNLPKLLSQSFTGLKQMLHIARENVSALEALDIKLDDNKSSGFILESIFVNKLDSETRKQYELSLDSNQVPTHIDLLRFLSHQVDSLETFIGDRSHKYLSSSKHTFKQHKTQTPVKSKQEVTLLASSVLCCICKGSHELNTCSEFISRDPKSRYNLIKKHNLCVRCFKSGHSTRNCPSNICCSICSKHHNDMLHFRSENVIETSTTSNNNTVSLHSGSTTSVVVLLATARVDALNNAGTYTTSRCLFDCGSQSSFITEACAKKLKLTIKRCNTTIISLGNQPVNLAKGVVHVSIKPVGKSSPTFEITAIVVDSITHQTPNQRVSLAKYNCIRQLNLADPGLCEPGNIDLLLSADVFGKSLLNNKFTELNGPTAIETHFGWLVLGEIDCNFHPTTTHAFKLSAVDNLDTLLHKFWEVESVTSYIPQQKKEDIRVERIYSDTVFRDSSGRYCVALPFKEFPPKLGHSYYIAKSCLSSLLRRLENNPSLQKDYDATLKDYIDQGHMIKVDSSCPTNTNNYYIPHLAVVRSESVTSSVRVVFNASKRTTNGVSLNDVISAGPPLQHDISGLLFRIRFFKILLSTDIKQMFRQILVLEEHRKYQRILHKFKGDSLPQAYELRTVTFGVDSSPYLANRTIQQLARDEEHVYPLAAEILKNDVYVDDILTGVDDLSSANEIVRQLIGIFKSGGFLLHKWASNNLDALHSIPKNERRLDDVSFETGSHIKLLGIKWSPVNDKFLFEINVVENAPCTKRAILSEVARWYDPLGFCSPLTMKLKHLIQLLWLGKLDWDDPPPKEIENEWQQFLSELKVMPVISIPRQVVVNKAFRLVCFSDASEKGYSACIYIRSENKNNVRVRLLCSKTKVSPLKRISIARLELCGCYLLSTLLTKILIFFPHPPVQILALTDSLVALYWISNSPHRWKTFVANRVTHIQEVLPSKYWAHVRTTNNIADVASRGTFPLSFSQNTDWLEGPKWLREPEINWPVRFITDFSSDLSQSENLEQSKSLLLKENKFTSYWFEKYSSFAKLQKIIAHCLRFISNARKKVPIKSCQGKGISSYYLDLALITLVKLTQSDSLHTVLQQLKDTGICPKEFRSLSPFIDKNGCIRVGGRLSQSEFPYDRKYPYLLPSKHSFTKLIINHYHLKYKHIGPQGLLSILVQKFWIISAKRVIRSQLSKCISCFRYNPIFGNPVMGDLPSHRVTPSKPFSKCGVDYGGPYSISISRRRGQVTQKAYICLFVCFATKAIHLELASDLSTATFLAALRRFISRRGRVTDMYSDCGTNFVGANRYLTELQKLLTSSNHNNLVANALLPDAINWHFNPPSAPHFGGLWEAGIKSTKKLLHRALGKQILTYEEFSTLLTEIEAILNSRPLYPMSHDPSDLSVLTPGHFLVNEPLVCLPSDDLTDVPLNRLSHWEAIQKLRLSFWKLWKDNYLNTLQQRKKWSINSSSVKEGTLVVINDHPTPPTDWRLGRVVKLLPGKDSISRVAKVLTKYGEITRSIARLAPLPLGEKDTTTVSSNSSQNKM